MLELIWMDWNLQFNRTPTETGETPRALFPPMEHKYNLKGNIKDKNPATEVKFSETKNSMTNLDPQTQAHLLAATVYQ